MHVRLSLLPHTLRCWNKKSNMHCLERIRHQTKWSEISWKTAKNRFTKLIYSSAIKISGIAARIEFLLHTSLLKVSSNHTYFHCWRRNKLCKIKLQRHFQEHSTLMFDTEWAFNDAISNFKCIAIFSFSLMFLVGFNRRLCQRGFFLQKSNYRLYDCSSSIAEPIACWVCVIPR